MRLAPSREAARNKRLDLSKSGLEALKVRHAIGCGKTECEGRVAVRSVEVRVSERLRFGRNLLFVVGQNGSAPGIRHALLLGFYLVGVLNLF
jgi:hypothetical protein